ncbi:MAG: transketolase [Actinomycetia bacterium]|nr:transketolase [Actinomycetes bacterium]MCP4960645.1 transketolase [Actinomycetes bacterium]
MSSTVEPDLELRQVNVVRGLALDAVKAANSGHTGTAMALAPLAHVLWTRVMNFDSGDPTWPDRDRFVLSPGHASMLLYSMLHLTGHGLGLDDIKDFRQLGSQTPGHPEVGHTAGVEVTTGPLGQGLANAVGMALAERHLRARFGAGLVDHRTFAIVSDGDLMEGISHEAASFAGNQQLGRLVCIYDDNHITIDGPTEVTLTDDAAARFRAYGWHVDDIGEAANDLDAIEAAIDRALEVEDAPSLVIVRSRIGYPLPDSTDTSAAHGAITGDDEIAAVKQIMGLPVDDPFHVPDEVLTAYRNSGRRGQGAREEWERRLADWGGNRERFNSCLSGTGLADWADNLPTFETGTAVATRKANSEVINALADVVPGLVSGSADLTGNTGTGLDSSLMSADHPDGRLVAYGVREHAMGAIANGMALHGGVVPAVGTFLVFADYMRGAVRLSALSNAKVIYVWSHDSVGVGEDGPTHQPVEQVASLRAIPNLDVFRPADATEVAGAWHAAIAGDGPAAMILTRQNVPVLAGTSADAVARGAYTVLEASQADEPALVLVSTGSEVHLCVEAAERLAAGGVDTRVVSMPCWERFADQDAGYRNSVLPGDVPTVSAEAGTSFGWAAHAHAHVAIDRFGLSAPGDLAMAECGITADNIVEMALSLLDR